MENREKILGYIAEFICSQEYNKAKTSDFNIFAESEYLIIIGLIKEKVSKILNKAGTCDNTVELETTIKQEISPLMTMKQKKSEIRRAVLKFLENLQKEIAAPKNNGKNTCKNSNFANNKPQSTPDTQKKCIEINKNILQIFNTKNKNTILNNILNIFKTQGNIMDHVNLSTIINKISKTFSKEDIEEKIADIIQIVILTTNLITNTNFDSKGIGIILYGLKNMTPHIVGKKFMEIMTQKIETHPDNFTQETIGRIFYGLQNLDSSIVQKKFFEVMIKKIEECTELNTQAIGNILYGIQNMNSLVVSKKFFEVMIKKIEECTKLDTQAIGCIFYGLQNMDSSVVSKEFFEVITKKIEECTELDTQAIGCIFYGLQNMDNSVVPKKFFEVMIKKIEEHTKLDIQTIANTFYGLKNISSSIVPKEFFRTMTKKIVTCQKLNSQAIGNIVYGLRNMDSSVVSKEFFEIMTQKIEENKSNFLIQEISNTVLGLQNMDNSVVPKKLLIVLTKKIQKSINQLNPQTIGNIMYGLTNLYKEMKNECTPLLEILLKELQNPHNKNEINIISCIIIVQSCNLMEIKIPDHIKITYQNFKKSHPLQNVSNGEKTLTNHIKNTYKGTILTNTYIDGFELDIYLPEKRLNIEYDGIQHLKCTGKDKKRDTYLLKKYNIKTVRIPPEKLDEITKNPNGLNPYLS